MAYLGDEFMTEGYLETLEHITGLESAEILGRLMFLWHISQKRKMQTGSAANLTAWSKVKKNGPKWISALLEVQLLKQVGDDEYEIVGNAKRFEYIEKRTNKARNAAEARWAPLKLVKKADAPSIANALLNDATTTTTTTTTKKDIAPGPVGPIPLDLVRVWNDNRKSLPGCKPKLNDQRRKAAASRLAEEPDLEKWAACVRAIADCEWCQGKNDRGWVATFEYLVRTQTMTKFEEGFFHRKAEEAPKSLYDSIDLPEVLP